MDQEGAAMIVSWWLDPPFSLVKEGVSSRLEQIDLLGCGGLF